jgi:phosphopantetheinyl transferase
MPLPFDRGYHTPDFGEASAAFLDYYQAIGLGVPQLPLYSCATTKLFPSSPAAVREVAAAQWSTTVRFRQTVQNMYDDGVRCFVEVGPSGNLTAFVDDVLADQAHLALATNVRRRHGLEQFLSTLAHLWVQGRPVALRALFERRQVVVIDLAVDQAVPRLPGLLDNTLPTLRFDAADRAEIRRLVSGAAVTTTAGHPVAPAPPVAEAQPAAATVAVPPAAPARSEAVDSTAQVVGEYFEMMRGFLAQQQQVLTGWQASPRADAAQPPLADEFPADSDSIPFAPFLDVVLAHDAHQLRAECHLSVHRDAFLRDHVLSGRGTDTDPDLIGLACVPLMVSLEIMAEACAVLAGGTGLRLIENVRASAWIALDDEQQVLDVSAEAVPGRTGRYRATLHQQGALAVSAEFDFDAAPKLQALDELGAVSAPRWDGAEIYRIGMFHGPVFQSLQHIRGYNGSGIDCELTACSLDGFFSDGEAAPMMVLNPVLLDAMGQLAACWIAEHVGTDFNCFPSTMSRVELFAGHAAPAPGIVLRGRQQAVDPSQAADIAAARSWSFEAVGASGQPLVRVAGLVNVFFPVPHRFYQVRRDPLGAWLGEPLSAGFDSFLWQLEHLPEEFCVQSDAIFLRMLAFAILSFEERDAWRALEKNQRRRRQWLMGRLALKEIVRCWLHLKTGRLLYPSDIVVYHDDHGKPSVGGWWEESIGPAPQVSLTHDATASIAAVSPAGDAVGVDAERIGRVQRPELLSAAFTAAERGWLQDGTRLPREEAVLRLWCAKEAAAKFGGIGLRGVPEAFEVTFESGMGEIATVRYDDNDVRVKVQRSGNLIVAVAEDHVVPAKAFG